MSFSGEKNKPGGTGDFGVIRNYAKKTLNEIIYEDLKDKILRGDIPSKKRLQEDNLTKDYETSRTPIRDALRKLEQENIIEKLPYGGYEIKDVDIEEIEEIFGIRSVLESYAASLATKRITEAEVEKIEEILVRAKEALKNDDYETFIDLDTEFHTSFYKASRSEHLVRILLNLWDYFIRYRKIAFLTKPNLEDSLKGHQIILKKLKEGDQKAVENLVREHVNNALYKVKVGLKKDG
jgi:DNA-binding GntR family transcriptional regulator